MKDYKKGDYVLVPYDNEMLTGKVLKIIEDTEMALVEVCLSSRRGERLLTDTVEIAISEIQDLGIVKN